MAEYFSLPRALERLAAHRGVRPSTGPRRRTTSTAYNPERERAKYLRQKAALGGRVPRYEYVHDPDVPQPDRYQCWTCQRWCDNDAKGRRFVWFCSPACSAWMRARVIGELSWYRTSARPAHKRDDHCDYCGEEFPRRSNQHRWCSERCRRRGRRSHGVTKAKRRAVIERDGWVCHICSEPIDPDLPWHDGRASTIDHLVSVHCGGGDELENLAHAHRGCNASRGAARGLHESDLPDGEVAPGPQAGVAA